MKAALNWILVLFEWSSALSTSHRFNINFEKFDRQLSFGNAKQWLDTNKRPKLISNPNIEMDSSASKCVDSWILELEV